MIGSSSPIHIRLGHHAISEYVQSFFGKFSQSLNTEIFPELQHWFFDQLNIGSLTVDLDSTVITRFGDKHGSAKGCNPNKRGRNSHHPLMAFVEQTPMVANAWL